MPPVLLTDVGRGPTVSPPMRAICSKMCLRPGLESASVQHIYMPYLQMFPFCGHVDVSTFAAAGCSAVQDTEGQGPARNAEVACTVIGEALAMLKKS